MSRRSGAKRGTGDRHAAPRRSPGTPRPEGRAPGSIDRRDLGDLVKKTGIWLFVIVFLTSILGVAVVTSTR